MLYAYKKFYSYFKFYNHCGFKGYLCKAFFIEILAHYFWDTLHFQIIILIFEVYTILYNNKFINTFKTIKSHKPHIHIYRCNFYKYSLYFKNFHFISGNVLCIIISTHFNICCFIDFKLKKKNLKYFKYIPAPKSATNTIINFFIFVLKVFFLYIFNNL